ncbi:MAG: matrixin family metalloprotease [bacterium]|nr:matrixin family metalloprotease [bacterium]
MKIFQGKFFAGAFIILLFLGFGYYYRENVSHFLQMILNRVQPCQRPITYSIASIDPRFGLTKEELLNAIEQAEKIWESPVNKQLFQYSPTGNLKINFIYDYRQEATDALRKIGIVIKDDRSTYDTVKAKYDSLIAVYNKEKTQIDALVATYNQDKSAFEKDVSYWNTRGGAPKEEYKMLEQRRADLNNQVIAINQVKDSFNGLVNTINSTEIILNKLIATLNLQVSKYNTVGSSAGKQFNEGEYISKAGGATINIFEFNNNSQLVRVLAHELGHALILSHIDNPKAIMYYLNEGVNDNLTADDLTALENKCRIK